LKKVTALALGETSQPPVLACFILLLTEEQYVAKNEPIITRGLIVILINNDLSLCTIEICRTT
jgi:hypothetical protein